MSSNARPAQGGDDAVLVEPAVDPCDMAEAGGGQPLDLRVIVFSVAVAGHSGADGLLGRHPGDHQDRRHPVSPPTPPKGLEEFSHLEVVFRFHLTDPADLNLSARQPRDNPDWPEVGIFGHRNMRRINWLGEREPPGGRHSSLHLEQSIRTSCSRKPGTLSWSG